MNKNLLIMAILGVAVLPAQAQMDAQPCTFQIKKVKVPKQIVSTVADVELKVDLETVDCSIPVNLNLPVQAKPPLIVMKPKPGLLGHGDIGFKKFEPLASSATEARAHQLEARLKAKTTEELLIGDQLVDVELTYNAIDKSGNPVEGRFDFKVPIHVVVPPPTSFWEKHKTTTNVLTTTAVVILAVPLFALYIILSAFGVLKDC